MKNCTKASQILINATHALKIKKYSFSDNNLPMTFIKLCDILSSRIGFMEVEHYVILVSLELTTNDVVSKIIQFETRKANITTWRQVYIF